MDNRLISQIKRALKITLDYVITLILFMVFFVPVISLAKDNLAGYMPYLSFVLFLVLFFTGYIDMRMMAFKEKRPQYNINPSPFKGFYYGGIAIIPIAVIQIMLMLMNVPEGFSVLKRRLLQGFSGPLYWFAKLLGDNHFYYVVSLVLVVIIAGIGYYAGHKEFLFTEFVKRKLGIKKKVRKQIKRPIKKN